jgi:FkbM family methyltransferase
MKIIKTKDQHYFIYTDSKKKKIIDLGYNDGSFERDVNNIFPQYDYVAVEANPIFKKTIKARLLNYIISNQSNKISTFGIDIYNSGNSSSIYLLNKKKLSVKTISLIDLYLLSKFNIIDILKIDIEFSEYKILTKKNIFFLSKNTKQIVVEFHQNNKKTYTKKIKLILKLFESYNFYFKKFSSLKTEAGSYLFLNKGLIDVDFFLKTKISCYKYYYLFLRFFKLK